MSAAEYMTPGELVVGDEVVEVVVGGSRTTFISVERPGYNAGGGVALVHLKACSPEESRAFARAIAQVPAMMERLEHSANAMANARLMLLNAGHTYANPLLKALAANADEIRAILQAVAK